MKKYLSWALALIMVLGLFAGCNNEITDDKGEIGIANSGGVVGDKDWYGEEDGVTSITLYFWGAVGEEYGYKKIIENFNEAYKDKGLQAEYRQYTNSTDGNTQLETKLMTGEEIDCIIGYGSLNTLKDRGDKGLLVNLSDYLKDMQFSGKTGFDIAEQMGNAAAADVIHAAGSVKNAKEGTTYDVETVYGIPSKFDNKGMMLINVDMFKEAGVEVPYTGWTYSEFLSAVEKLTQGEGADKRYGVCWYCNGIGNAQVYVQAAIGDYYYYTDDTCTTAALDNPIWVEGLELLKTTMNNGWACDFATCTSETHKIDYFINEKCAIFGLFSQIRQCMDTENYDHDFVTALVPCPVPDSKGNDAELKTMAGMTYTGEYVSVCANSAHPEQAAEFLRWFLMGGMNPSIMAGRYPLWSGTDTNDVMNTIKEMAGDLVDTKSIECIFSVDRSNLTKSAPSASYDSKVKSALKKAWENYLITDNPKYATAEEAMAAAQQEAQAAIDDALKKK